MFRRPGVTLIELLLAAAFIGAGVASSISAGTKWGVVGYVGGFLIGTVAAFTAFFAFGFTVAFIIGLLTGIPELPVCANGKCRDRAPPNGDYRYEDISGQLVARCKCGIPYVKKGRRVQQLQADGSRTPYMIWKPLRGWFVDED